MKVAVIGNGIVGATTSYILSKNDNVAVTQFDSSKGQATSASAGIIAPWLSKRRNKKWYRLSREGAAFMNQLAHDTKMPSSVYREDGVVYSRKIETDIDDLLELGQERKVDAPLMAQLQKLSPTMMQEKFPFTQISDWGLFVEGGATIDGQKFVEYLNQQTDFEQQYLNQTVSISNEKGRLSINGVAFDKVVLAVGAWLPQCLESIGWTVNVRPQKGQLIEVQLPDEKVDSLIGLPVLMPEGERDFIPTNKNTLIIGATHENDEGFDLSRSQVVMDDLLKSGQNLIPNLTEADIIGYRVGTRAYTNDFAPFFGELEDNSNIYVASGLGSSGLTTGPIIGQMLAKQVLGADIEMSEYTNPVNNYIDKRG